MIERRAGAVPLTPARDIRKFSRTLSAGEDVFRAGERGSSMFVVLAGAVEVLEDPVPEVITRLATGDTFGEIALVSTGVRTRTVRAVETPTHLMEIDRARFVYLVGQQPAFALTVMRNLCRRIEAMDNTLKEARHG
jgi:CRP-like cAMP-binding protein